MLSLQKHPEELIGSHLWWLGIAALFISLPLIFGLFWPVSLNNICSVLWAVSILVPVLKGWDDCFRYEPPLVCHSGLKQIGNPVKHFDPAVRGNPETETSIAGLIYAIDQELKKKCPRPITILVVDDIKQDLEGKHELVHDDNSDSASARAGYIVGRIKEGPFKSSEVEALSIVARSSRHGSENDMNKDDGMARDGSVSVYGLWAVKQGEGSRGSKVNN